MNLDDIPALAEKLRDTCYYITPRGLVLNQELVENFLKRLIKAARAPQHTVRLYVVDRKTGNTLSSHFKSEQAKRSLQSWRKDSPDPSRYVIQTVSITDE